MPRYLLRVAVPDRPGRLGAVTTALGQLEANIVGFDLIEVADGVAVDQIQIDATVGTAQRLPAALEAIPGAVVEFLRPMAPDVEGLSALELAHELVTVPPDRLLDTLTTMLPVVAAASWAAVIEDAPAGSRVLAASHGAPDLDGIDTPWMPIHTPRGIPTGPWSRGFTDDAEGTELAGVPIGDGALLVARHTGPRFRGHELEDLDLLARICDRLADRSPDGR